MEMKITNLINSQTKTYEKFVKWCYIEKEKNRSKIKKKPKSIKTLEDRLG